MNPYHDEKGRFCSVNKICVNGNTHYNLKGEPPKKYIRYGSIDYNKTPIIKNGAGFGNKPFGALWFSPDNAKYSWRDFCKTEGYLGSGDFFDCDSKERNEVELQNAKIYHIYTKEDVDRISRKGEIDFVSLSKYFDGIEFHLTEADSRKTLDGWDCDSMCLFNTNVLKKD